LRCGERSSSNQNRGVLTPAASAATPAQATKQISRA
jgi:hypothetical protein